MRGRQGARHCHPERMRGIPTEHTESSFAALMMTIPPTYRSYSRYYPYRLQIAAPLCHPVVHRAEIIGRPGQEPAAGFTPRPAFDRHLRHEVMRDPPQEI